MEIRSFICFDGTIHPTGSHQMTTLAQDLFNQRVTRHWVTAMNECLAEYRRLCVLR
jgi:hypothetical protein